MTAEISSGFIKKYLMGSLVINIAHEGTKILAD
jgi:hypothetical protein